MYTITDYTYNINVGFTIQYKTKTVKQLTIQFIIHD